MVQINLAESMVGQWILVSINDEEFLDPPRDFSIMTLFLAIKHVACWVVIKLTIMCKIALKHAVL
jgi:hypothetical protein